MFEQAQSRLKARNPPVTAPCVVAGPILLTGLRYRRGAMALRTGTSKTGKVHRYCLLELRPARSKGVQGRTLPGTALHQQADSERICGASLAGCAMSCYRDLFRSLDHARELLAE